MKYSIKFFTYTYIVCKVAFIHGNGRERIENIVFKMRFDYKVKKSRYRIGKTLKSLNTEKKCTKEVLESRKHYKKR